MSSREPTLTDPTSLAVCMAVATTSLSAAAFRGGDQSAPPLHSLGDSSLAKLLASTELTPELSGLVEQLGLADDSTEPETEATSTEMPAPGAPSTVSVDPAELAASGWADPNDSALIESLAGAPWQVVDTETTGLTQASKPVKLTKKALTAGSDNTLRVRVLTAVWPNAEGQIVTAGWDLDTLTADQRARLACAALQGVFVGHNATFDLGWLMPLAPDTRPERVLDTLLFARLIVPESPVLLRARIAKDPRILDEVGQSVGWGLAALCHVHGINEHMDKTYQKPRHWTDPAPLSRAHYDYALGDVVDLHKLVMVLVGTSVSTDLLAAYDAWKQSLPAYLERFAALYERAPLQLADLHLRGMPLSREGVAQYVAQCAQEAQEQTEALIALAPGIAPYREGLADIGTGTSAALKNALAKALLDYGITVERTPKSDAPKVGEKDLRGLGITHSPAAPLFHALARINHATKRAGMALALLGFADRADDGRVHSLYAPVTATVRLSSSEPNLQNAPSVAAFRALVRAGKGKKIISCDYSAIDVRVGAALAIREQRRIVRALNDEDYAHKTYGQHQPDFREAVALAPSATTDAISEARETADQAYANRDWSRFDTARQTERVAVFALALRTCLNRLAPDVDTATALANLQGVDHRRFAGYSALRNAFCIGMDVHTYTGLRMLGRDPEAEVAGLSGPALKARMDELKEEIGDARKRGKVSNLSLLYGMAAVSFRRHAAKVFDVHMSEEEAQTDIDLWLNAYPEIRLLSASTHLRSEHRYNPDGLGGRFGLHGSVRIYDPKHGKAKHAPICSDTTLMGRPVVAAGLNASLNYPDQGSGADLLMRVLDRLERETPDLYAAAINQVHDELVFEVDAETAEVDKDRIRALMTDEGRLMLGDYGMPMDASIVVDDVWMKD